MLNEELRSVPPRPGAKVTYGINIQNYIVILWRAMSMICSKNMVAAIPLWLEYYYGISPEGDTRLKQMKASNTN